MLDSRLNPDEWGDWRWRLSNIYTIVNEKGDAIPFRPNPTQLAFLEQLWYLNCILKSRQHGFSTLIQLLALDQAVFRKNFSAGVIAHTLHDGQAIFRDKVRYAYDKLPDQIREAVAPKSDSTTELVLSNGSKVYVGTSLRGGTLQLLHVSEFGKICARFPEKAREIVTGALNTVHVGQWIFVESTAEGMHGPFYDLCQTSEKLAVAGTPLTPLDFRFHFYPWWKDPRNRLDPTHVPIPEPSQRYFAELQKSDGIVLDAAQKAWYVKKLETQKDDMKREHPSTPGEAFEGAVEGAIYAEQMRWLRGQGRIRSVPWVPTEPVNTFWDLGRNAMNAMWFHQFIAGEHRFIRYYENHLKDLSHYYRYMQDECRGYLWGEHYLPHDAEQENLERGETRVDRLVELGVPEEKIKVVERIEDIGVGIELTKKMFPLAWIDREGCDQGIKCLDNYKYEWDEKHGCWRNTPGKGWANNGADAFRQWAQGWDGPRRKTATKRKARSWRSA